MSGAEIAWWVAGLGAVGLAGCVYGFFRRTRYRRVLLMVVVVLVAVLLVPAPVPGFEGHYAPAFLVAPFEAAFQADGRPEQAAKILAAGAIGGLVAGALLLGVGWLKGVLRR
ncbi:MAG: hypothetical protein H6993_06800 [Pseudomonadales bacterium]|nr:hypothetical protein [Pseudomonadales bacterium]